MVVKHSGENFAVDFLSWQDGVDAMLKPSED